MMERTHDMAELRTFSEFEARQQADGSWKVGGYASTFNDPYEVNDRFGSFTETIRSGTWDRTLSERGHKIQLTEGHFGLPYASTKANNLRLGTDAHGLEWEATLSPESQRCRDLGIGIHDGYIDELSVGMNVKRDAWSPTMDKRDVSEASLLHIAVVARGANPNTEAAMREQELLAEIRSLRSMMGAVEGPVPSQKVVMAPHVFQDNNNDGKCDVCGLDQTGHDQLMEKIEPPEPNNPAPGSGSIQNNELAVSVADLREALNARQYRLPIHKELAQLLERRK